MGLTLLIYFAVNLTHAAGHLLAAKLLKIRIHRLSFGIGPTLRQWSWNGITVRITPLPVAVLIQLRRRWNRGEGPPEAEPGSFRAASRAAQLGVICGPLVLLLLLGWCAAFHLHGVGVPVWGSARVGAVQPGGPAEAAGVRPGDVLLKVDGEVVRGWKDLRRLVSSSESSSLHLLVRRGEAKLKLEVEPRLVPGGHRIIGVHAGAELRRADGLGSRLRAATVTVGEMMGALSSGIWRIIVGGPPAPVGGPINNIRMVEHEDKELRASFRARLITLSIVNYLFVCLLPLPFLDGRRLLFWALGVLARRPLHPRWEQGYNRWGFAVVGLLLLVVTAKDVLRYS
jgi:regulator of sigma E protease